MAGILYFTMDRAELTKVLATRGCDRWGALPCEEAERALRQIVSRVQRKAEQTGIKLPKSIKHGLVGTEYDCFMGFVPHISYTSNAMRDLIIRESRKTPLLKIRTE